jgi:hypothetical protein
VHPSRPGLGPTQPPILWVQGLSWGLGDRDVALTDPPTSSADVKERVELYLYSLLGPRRVTFTFTFSPKT